MIATSFNHIIPYYKKIYKKTIENLILYKKKLLLKQETVIAQPLFLVVR